MIAAAAIIVNAELATADTEHFMDFIPLGLRLTKNS
jgi:predicted nucleic acid-binding protein